MSHEHPNEYTTSDPTSHSWMLNNRQELHKYDESNSPGGTQEPIPRCMEYIPSGNLT